MSIRFNANLDIVVFILWIATLWLGYMFELQNDLVLILIFENKELSHLVSLVEVSRKGFVLQVFSSLRNCLEHLAKLIQVEWFSAWQRFM